MATQDRTKPPTQDDLNALPRWACVAFAARCARRVQPLFVKGWPNAPDEHRQALDKAVTLTESAARVSRAAEGLADFASASASAADAANAAANAASAYAAYAAGYAFASAAADAAADAAAAAYAANAAANVIRTMWADIDVLLAIAASERWTDDSSVDPDLCGPLWPEGAPEGWPQGETGAAPVLVLEIAVDQDSDDDAVNEKIARLLGHLSQLHVAYGGSGLKLAEGHGRAFSPTPVLQPAGDGGGQ